METTEENKCIECSETVDYDGGDDSRWSSVKGGTVCWSCYESGQQYASVAHILSEGEILKVYVGDLDIHDEYGDPVDERLGIKREYVSTDGWRGYYNTTIEGWVNVLDGWTTGSWGDPIADRKANFNEWAEALLTQEIYAPCSVAIVTDPTSNVFSTAITVLVKKDDVESFRAWLSDDYDNLYNALT
jgi:hypothetical protein